MELLKQMLDALSAAIGWVLGNNWLLPSEFRLLPWIFSTTGIVFLLVIVLERLFPFKRHSFDRSNLTTTAYIMFGSKIAIFVLFVVPAIRTGYEALGLPSLALESRLPFLVYSGTAFLSMSFVDYWAHRWLHRVPWLWHIHKIHHAPEHLHFATRYHVHFGMQILHGPLWVLTSMFLGVQLAAPFGALTILIDFFAHANIRLKMGWLNYLIVTPEVHRYHHGRDPRYYHTNYSNSFPFWDMVFGTYHYDPDEPAEEFGLNEEIPEGFIAQQLYPFVSMARDVRARMSRSDHRTRVMSPAKPPSTERSGV